MTRSKLALRAIIVTRRNELAVNRFFVAVRRLKIPWKIKLFYRSSCLPLEPSVQRFYFLQSITATSTARGGFQGGGRRFRCSGESQNFLHQGTETPGTAAFPHVDNPVHNHLASL
jgi:hypothetical protein